MSLGFHTQRLAVGIAAYHPTVAPATRAPVAPATRARSSPRAALRRSALVAAQLVGDALACLLAFVLLPYPLVWGEHAHAHPHRADEAHLWRPVLLLNAVGVALVVDLAATLLLLWADSRSPRWDVAIRLLSLLTAYAVGVGLGTLFPLALTQTDDARSASHLPALPVLYGVVVFVGLVKALQIAHGPW